MLAIVCEGQTLTEQELQSRFTAAAATAVVVPLTLPRPHSTLHRLTEQELQTRFASSLLGKTMFFGQEELLTMLTVGVQKRTMQEIAIVALCSLLHACKAAGQVNALRPGGAAGHAHDANGRLHLSPQTASWQRACDCLSSPRS